MEERSSRALQQVHFDRWTKSALASKKLKPHILLSNISGQPLTWTAATATTMVMMAPSLELMQSLQPTSGGQQGRTQQPDIGRGNQCQQSDMLLAQPAGSVLQ
jgi:hypothetical protein